MSLLGVSWESLGSLSAVSPQTLLSLSSVSPQSLSSLSAFSQHSLSILSAVSQQFLSSLSALSQQSFSCLSEFTQQSLSTLSSFTSLYPKHTSSNQQSTKYFILFPIGWQNPQNQYFPQKWKKVRQIDIFHTCLSSGLEGPNSKISKPKIKPLPSAFRQLGQFGFSLGGKLHFREGGQKECKTCSTPKRDTSLRNF